MGETIIVLPIHYGNDEELVPIMKHCCLCISLPIWLPIVGIYKCCKKIKGCFKKESECVIVPITQTFVKETECSNKKDTEHWRKINEYKNSVGHDIWNLIDRGSHNEAVVAVLKKQPQSILDAIFKEVQWNCGKERLSFLQKRVGYDISHPIIGIIEDDKPSVKASDIALFS